MRQLAGHGRQDRRHQRRRGDPPALAVLRPVRRNGGGPMSTAITSLTDAERAELSRKNAEQNKQSESNRR
ncbi:hypothetical protein GCM10010342_76110 [Streptomyces anulatus]|nr:hypothetical protein GCM10010342_76110 [Streptomyces anulatus]